ncbi:putative RNA methyltransferase [Actinoplanes subtropicus]|uniref:putative RNA methyltransferase n=1 Tax=Actinoplanes subtropicus TaxID=543632 RepID=UPI00068FAA62|nr:methyltransferase domain-containing protein [Actinoplanes subtropicus]
MIDGALPYLRCPICARPLVRRERTLRCAGGHSFDMAKQGYADLSAGRLPHTGDSAGMVADRETFLAAGHYDFIADALAAAAPSGFLIDAGVGTGFYLSRALGETSSGVGLDVSKPALRRAARAHPRAAAVLADLWRPLPIVDGVAAAILNVFAPRNGAEFRRVLRPDGVLLVVTPTAGHLRELVTAYGMIGVDPDKSQRVRDSLDDYFALKATKSLSQTLHLTASEARTLIGMTPSAHHGVTAPENDVTVSAEVTLSIYIPVHTERSTSSHSGGLS